MYVELIDCERKNSYENSAEPLGKDCVTLCLSSAAFLANFPFLLLPFSRFTLPVDLSTWKNPKSITINEDEEATAMEWFRFLSEAMFAARYKISFYFSKQAI